MFKLIDSGWVCLSNFTPYLDALSFKFNSLNNNDNKCPICLTILNNIHHVKCLYCETYICISCLHKYCKDEFNICKDKPRCYICRKDFFNLTNFVELPPIESNINSKKDIFFNITDIYNLNNSTLLLFMYIYLSFISSLLYWIVSNINLSLYYQIPSKSLAILPLLFISNNPLTLSLFIIGDCIIFFNIQISLLFFIFGHLYYIYCHYGLSIFYFIPLFIPSSFVISKLFPNGIMFKLYIISLHLLFTYSIVNSDYFICLFIISDIIIGLEPVIQSVFLKSLTWPLYYAAILLCEV